MTQATLERPSTTTPSIAHACEPETIGLSAVSTGIGSDPGRQRLIGIDAARGLALLGMMVVHIVPAYAANGEVLGVWSLSAGKSAALFAVAAGVGVAMTSGRPERLVGRKYASVSVSLIARALLIGALGLLLGVLVPNDAALIILPYYAILFVLAIPLLRLTRRWLIAVGLVVALVVPLASHFWRAREGGIVTEPFNPTFITLFSDPGQVLTMMTATGLYPALAWVAYICAGLVVGRCVLARRSTSAGIMMLGLTLASFASALSWFLLEQAGGRAAIDSTSSSAIDVEDILAAGAEGTLPTTTPWWLAVNAPHTTTPLDLLFTIGVAVAVLGAMILLGRAAGPALKPLTAIGSMPLTMYATHLLFLAQPWRSDDPVIDYTIQLVALTTLAIVWSHYFRRGPLEQVVRTVANGAGRRVLPVEVDGDRREASERGRHRTTPSDAGPGRAATRISPLSWSGR